MIKSFITSFKLKNTYKVNSIIYSIKQLPIIKKILPNKLYQNKALKNYRKYYKYFMADNKYISRKIFVCFSYDCSSYTYDFKNKQCRRFFAHIFIFNSNRRINEYIYVQSN